MKQDEKILLLGALFHDIGKFEQRCGLNPTTKHTILGKNFIESLSEQFQKIVGKEGFDRLKQIIEKHHDKNVSDDLIKICQLADHISASERVGFDMEDDYSDKWSHKHMLSLFSKIYLVNDEEKKYRYYKHLPLTKKNYDILIPTYETEEDIKNDSTQYRQEDFENFTNDVKAVLNFYEAEDDFHSLINLLLIVFEKYMWSIPDFTGSAYTDISLYNHLKDVAGIAHAIFKSDFETNKSLNLIIADLPGIQSYIFNVTYKKPAKILRGRSIFVQILTRQFASIILNYLGLTESSLIMLAGGKFYILAQNSKEFDEKMANAIEDIEEILIRNFNYQLSFSLAYQNFNFEDLKNGIITFGDVIEQASYKLLSKRHKPFESVLFEYSDFDENDFILWNKYIEPTDIRDSNNIKCAVTGLPIRKGYDRTLDDSDDKLLVDRQVKNEYLIGKKVPYSNVIVELTEDFSEVIKVSTINDFAPNNNRNNKIIINPSLDELLKPDNLKKDILRNSLIIEVANYTSNDKNSTVMDFEEMETHNKGAEILTLIKGDVDNLGLIMSYGLVGNAEANDEKKNDLTGLSRTTTLSNHLKYFFSFSLNGFLRDWEAGKILTSEEKKKFHDLNSDEFNEYIRDRKVYTVFAGGDDLMLIAPQSSSLSLVKTFNEVFNDFICENPEIHISFSLTNFKHNTPMRIVSRIAEDNQEKIKNAFHTLKIKDKIIAGEKDVFYPQNDKAGIRVFDTNLKLELIDKVFSYKSKLIEWEKDEKNSVSQGILRNLLYFAKIIDDYNRKGDSEYLMWHPKLSYMINRLLKDKNGKYLNKDVEEFFEMALDINKKDNLEAMTLEKILYPVVCEAIYGTRIKKENK